MIRPNPEDLVLLPLGGIGEIGMNLALYGFGPPRRRKWLMVDCGVAFGGVDQPGVDLIMPDTAFIEARRDDLLGIVITHAHEDHIGAVLALWPRLQVPVFATPFAAAFLAAKGETEPGASPVPVTVVAQDGRWTLGPFDLEFVPVSHSIPEPCSLVIRTPLGTVVHSGDWKIDTDASVGRPIDLDRFAAIGEEGVLAFVCDSTNAQRPGRSPSEHQVGHELEGIIRDAPARVAVTTFSSNVARIRSVMAAAAAVGREVVVIGRALHRSISVAKELGYLDGLPPLLDEDAYGYLPRDKVVLILTGSQGEPRAALARIAADDHRRVALSGEDIVVFSSRTIPGNEKAVNGIINALAKRGITVMTDRDGLVHVSGHPRRDELAELYKRLKPAISVPAHGEPMHLAAHAALARSLGVPEIRVIGDGEMLKLAPGEATVLEKYEPSVLYQDGRLLLPSAQSGVAERKRLAFAGAVVVSLALDGAGETVGTPAIALLGLPERDAGGAEFAAALRRTVDGTITSIPRPRRRDHALVAEAVRRAVRAAVAESWGKKPTVKVSVVSVD